MRLIPLLRDHTSLVGVGVASALAYLYLAIQTQGYDQPTLPIFLLVMSFCGLSSFLLFARYQATGRQVSILLLLVFAILFRLIGVWGLPVFEDDFYRYLWDGKMFVETGSPYGVAPAEFFSSTQIDEKFDHILSHINHPNIATVYGPVCQWVFGLSFLIAPGEIWPLQLVFGLFDIGIVLMLIRLAAPNWVMLYAWSPLMIKEFAFTAHPDVMGVALMLGAFLIMKKNRWFLAAVLLALAAATKVFALILVPFILGLRIRAWLVFILTAILVALPFGVLAAWKPEGLEAMANSWLFNAPLYTFLLQWFSFSSVKATLLGVFVLCWTVYLIRVTFGAQKAYRADVIYGLFFICVPVLNAWYYVWLLPFAVIYPSATAWVGSIVICFAYVIGLNVESSGLAPYEQPISMLVLQVSAILGAFTWDVWQRKVRRHIGRGQ